MKIRRLSTMIYLQSKKSLRKYMDCSESRLNEILKMDYQDALNEAAFYLYDMSRFGAAKKYIKPSEKDHKVMLFKSVHSYKHSVQLVSPEFDWDGRSGIDTSVLTRTKDDFIIDTFTTTDAGVIPICIRVTHRDNPEVVNGKKLTFTVSVCKEDGVFGTFLIFPSSSTVKVFMVHTNAAYCSKCLRCNITKDKMFAMRPRNMSDCGYALDLGEPMQILMTAMIAINAYVNRSKVVKEKNDGVKSIARTIMIAKNEIGDSEQLLPLYDYVYEYHESERKEYKGGHHAPPCAHKRRAHYRKCKHGDFILKDGKFIQVPKGAGNFIHIAESKVNWDNDDVKKIII